MNTTSRHSTPTPTPVSVARRLTLGASWPLLAGFWLTYALLIIVLEVMSIDQLSGEYSLVSLTRSATVWFPLVLSLITSIRAFVPLLVAGGTRKSYIRATLLTLATTTLVNTAALLTLLALEVALVSSRSGIVPHLNDQPLNISPDQMSSYLITGFMTFPGFLGAGVSGLLLGAIILRWGRTWQTWLSAPLCLLPVILSFLLNTGFAQNYWIIAVILAFLVSGLGMLRYAKIIGNTPIRPLAIRPKNERFPPA
ncbi:hypothetical protein [Lysinibacter sp. HNR]|uniref:hypothetical protein n=1 Tax=Lysinibacter sp. HNR TaxID=3031408 RepID=UPI002435FBE3|nr:hypothetical protein [Lysinibacter sp. HNR]WGD36922.1 hypothetical protein FrondiHNR_10770 [Lysinibacter sp. HNR]